MRLHKRLAFLVILAGSFFFPSGYQVEGTVTAPLVERTTHMIDSYGWYHVFGEVTNPVADGVSRTIGVTATFTSGYSYLEAVTTFTTLDTVKSGESASFNIVLANATKSSLVTSYTLGLLTDDRPGNVPYRLLDVVQDTGIIDGSGNYHVTGTVTNNIGRKASFVQIIATFKGGTDNNIVIYTDWVYSNPINLSDGQQTTFEIVAQNSTTTPNRIIKQTVLQVQCAEYQSSALTDLSLRVEPPLTRSVIQGGSITYRVHAVPNPVMNYSVNTVTYGVRGLPQGSSYTFSPSNTTVVGHPVNLTITTSAAIGVGVGNFSVIVTAEDGGVPPREFSTILTVTAAKDFELTISPPSSSVSQGTQATYTVTAKSGGGFSSSVALNYSNIPTGSTANFSSSTIIPTPIGATTTFRIYTNLGTTLGPKTFTVCGQGGSKSHCVNAQVTVTASTAPSFSLSVTPPERTVYPGNSTIFTVTVTSINSFSQAVQLAVTGNPAGTSATLDPTAVTPPANGYAESTLNVSATSTPIFGTFTIIVTGTSTGFATQSDNATLIVSSFVEPDFAVYVLPTTLSVIQNNSGTATIQVVSINNFDGAVDLTLQNRPTGVTFSIANPTVAPFPGGYVNTKLTVQTSSSTALGDYTMSLRGTSGGKTHSVDLGLAVINKTSPFPFKCIIATATYGSEFTPEVQFLRGFRDNRVLATTAGAEFMQVFNAWYYSFSPYVASWLASTPPAREVAKVFLAPLLAILHLSEISYTALAFTPEVAVTLAGVVASSLIGVIYFGFVLAIALRRRALQPWRRVLMFIALAWCLSLLLLTLGLIASISPVVMAATSLLVLSTITLGACSVPITVSRLKPLFWKPV